jgi:hypothetical protein
MTTENPYLGLRERAFGVTRDMLPANEPGKPWGVIMETGFAEGSFTVVALADGNASVYFSSGGGMIGGFAHAEIRDAAMACVRMSAALVDELAPAGDRRLPVADETIFYVLTDAGVLTAHAPEEDLGEKRHPLWPMFHAAHAVIGGYRMLEQSKQA